MSNPQDVLVNTAMSQVGYSAVDRKKNKYAEYLDKLGVVYNYPKNGFDWCDIFVDWCFITTFGLENGMAMTYQPKKGTGAGCEFSAQFYRNNKSFSNTPSIGSQIFFGKAGAESHTGIVVGITDRYVQTVEGNTGGGNGKVAKKSYLKTNSRIVGYGVPKWSIVKTTTNKKSYDEIAKEVIQGKWGNGEERKTALTKAGYDYNLVQKTVNKMLAKKTNNQIAYEVIEGKWGYGADRRNRLEQAGYDYKTIQKMVNTLLGY